MEALALIDSHAQFEGMEPWLPGAEIIECAVAGQVIDLHNTCWLQRVAIQITNGPPEVALDFRHETGRTFRILFLEVLDLALLQDPDDWFVNSQDQPDAHLEPDYATFFSVDYALGPSGLARFSINSVLGTLLFKARRVRWEEANGPMPDEQS